MVLAMREVRMSRSRTNHCRVSLSTSGTTAYAIAARVIARGIMNRRDSLMLGSFRHPEVLPLRGAAVRAPRRLHHPTPVLQSPASRRRGNAKSIPVGGLGPADY